MNGEEATAEVGAQATIENFSIYLHTTVVWGRLKVRRLVMVICGQPLPDLAQMGVVRPEFFDFSL